MLIFYVLDKHMTPKKVKIQEEKKVYCALKWTATQTFVLFLIVHLIDFVWGYSKRCSKACAWLCFLSSGKDGCVKRKWFYCCAHTRPDYLETHEDFSSCTFVRELQLCFSLFCSVKATLKRMSRMRGMLFSVDHHVVSAYKWHQSTVEWLKFSCTCNHCLPNFIRMIWINAFI